MLKKFQIIISNLLNYLKKNDFQIIKDLINLEKVPSIEDFIPIAFIDIINQSFSLVPI